MEFKTIVYIIIGVFWLLSRFFQKVKQEREPGQVDTTTPEPSAPSRRGAIPRQVMKRDSLSGKKNVPRQPDRLPSAVSLEAAGARQNSSSMVSPIPSPSEPVDISTNSSDAQRISDEIRNGQVDWRRAMIISELINKKS